MAKYCTYTYRLGGRCSRLAHPNYPGQLCLKHALECGEESNTDPGGWWSSREKEQLLEAACEAERLFGVDECERFAEELRRLDDTQ